MAESVIVPAVVVKDAAKHHGQAARWAPLAECLSGTALAEPSSSVTSLLVTWQLPVFAS